MSTYLLTCACGKEVPVEIGQAGGSVTCSCGAQLDVPPLRRLRQLPVAPADRQPARVGWAPRHGVMTASLLLAALLASICLWNRVSEPTVPKYDPARQLRTLDERLKTMTPVESWQRWVELYRPLANSGFSVFEDPMVAAIEQYIARQRFFQKTLLVGVAICIAVAVIAAFWPRAISSPRSDSAKFSA